MQAEAAAEMLRLWLKPRMGTQKVPSTAFSTSSLTPRRSLPKTSAVFASKRME